MADTDITDLKIGTNTMHIYKPAKDKVDNLDISIEKKKIFSSGYKFLYNKNGPNDTKKNYTIDDKKKELEKYVCLLQTFPFSNYDFNDGSNNFDTSKVKDSKVYFFNQDEADKKLNSSSTGYGTIDNVTVDNNNKNIYKINVEKDNVSGPVQTTRENVDEEKILFVNIDLDKYGERLTKEEYEKFIKDPFIKDRMNTLLGKYNINDSKANLVARKDFLENEKIKNALPKGSLSTTNSTGTSSDKSPLLIQNCEIKKQAEPPLLPIGKNTQPENLPRPSGVGDNQTSKEPIPGQTEVGGRRRKRRTKKRSAKRRRRTIKKRKSKRTKKTRRNKKTKRVRFKL
jgi:hypothetical protein